MKRGRLRARAARLRCLTDKSDGGRRASASERNVIVANPRAFFGRQRPLRLNYLLEKQALRRHVLPVGLLGDGREQAPCIPPSIRKTGIASIPLAAPAPYADPLSPGSRNPLEWFFALGPVPLPMSEHHLTEADETLDESKFVTFEGSPFQLYQPYPPAGDQPRRSTSWSKASRTACRSRRCSA